VRTAVGAIVLLFCLGLTGCSLFGKKQTARNNNAAPKPFLGSEKKDKTETTAMPRGGDGPLPGAIGYLAGRVVVQATDRPIKADIIIKNVDYEDEKAAPIHYWTDEDGYFYIPQLKVGQQYELVVRAKENNELISRRWYARPPHATLLIPLDKQFTNANTPPIPSPAPSLPGKKETPTKESSRDGSPAARLEAPIKMNEPNAPPPSAGGNSGGNAPNPANIANNEFRLLNPNAPQPANIPSPPPVPGTPPWEKAPEQSPPPAVPAVPRWSGSVKLPEVDTPVPSCGLFGDQLRNFALRDLKGNVWEYKRDHRGRLTLLDFWFHSCGPCLQEIPNLVSLQSQYGPYGLQVVSIACEQGTVEQQRANVYPIRNRLRINYEVLLSGGGPERCPVVASFQVVSYPTLILLDANGKIIWRSPADGMNENARQILRNKINDRLVTTQSMR
jgi:thiol-disulfide isomerase/thioredoxin